MRKTRRAPLIVIITSALLLSLCVWRVFQNMTPPSDAPAAGDVAAVFTAVPERAQYTMGVEVVSGTPPPASPAPDSGYKEPTIALYDTARGRVADVPLEEYLVGVVAAEMPVAYPLEALKAQAVAARTYTVNKLVAYGGQGCSKHKGADICSDSSHCQAYASAAQRKERWGGAFDANEALMARAVEETRGLIVTYEGKPILALFHANSGGRTEDAQAAFAQRVPYLISVDSGGEENEKHYTDTKTYTAAAFVKLVNGAYPKAKLTAAGLKEQVSVQKRTGAGRVETLKLGGAALTGRQARALFGLYSANFSISASKSGVAITSKGYGHGVGMSQAGARALADGGAAFDEILMHYYTGTNVEMLTPATP